MRKLVLSLVTMLSFGANAQSVNVKGGLNFASVSNTKAGVAVRGYLGASYEVPINEKWSFQPELLINLKGFGSYTESVYAERPVLRVNHGLGMVQTRYEKYLTTNNVPSYTMFYISLPLMMKYKIVEKFNVEAGLEPSILLNKNTGYEKTFDLGVGLGAGYQINEKLGVGVRYTLGLTNTVDYKDMPWMNEESHKNRNFQIGVTYKLK